MPTTRTPEQRARRMRNWGIFLVAYPVPGLFLVLSAYAIASFIGAQLAMSGNDVSAAMDLVKVLLGFAGLACLLGIFTAMPIGIYLIAHASTIKSEGKK